MKHILVTGASSGIGLATAKYLDSLGDTYQLVLVARREEKLRSLQAELLHPSEVIPFDLDQTDRIEQIFSACREKNIKFDGLVHCAGMGINMSIRSNVIKDTASVMQTNYYSFMELGRCFSSRKYSNDGASMVAMSSISPFTCYPGAASYAASKAAINTAVRVMAKEFMKRGIRVNAICPAVVDTPMILPSDIPKRQERQPLGIIPPLYIAYLVEYLLSDKAKYMTGTLIPVSAGMDY